MSKQNTVILICGPTAVGKTALALKLAQHFNTAILSADSRQCYREMTIGTAKPSQEELQLVPHYFINSHSIQDVVNAGVFEQLGLHYLEEIFSRRPVAIVCGGTGLYIKALLEGIDDMPGIPDNIREGVRQFYQTHGLEGLQQALQKYDPAFYKQAEQKNPHRLMRALEVWQATGQSVLSFRKNKQVLRPFRTIRIGLELPKEQLWKNISYRTEKMIQSGLADEVKNLIPQRHLKALQTVGYKEMFRYLDGDYDLSRAENEISLHTRQYAKRQLTWFKRDPSTPWFPADKHEDILHHIQEETGNFA